MHHAKGPMTDNLQDHLKIVVPQPLLGEPFLRSKFQQTWAGESSRKVPRAEEKDSKGRSLKKAVPILVPMNLSLT